MPALIDIHSKPNVYRWAAELDFVTDSRGRIEEFHGEINLVWGLNYILRLKEWDIHPNWKAAGLHGYRLQIEASDTASRAEDIGTKLALGVLSLAVDKSFGVALSNHDQPLPCSIMDRTRRGGDGMRAFATVSGRVTFDVLCSYLEREVAKDKPTDHNRLLSMEVFCAAQLERSDRAKLILLISAAEALADQEDFTEELGPTISKLIGVIEEQEIRDGLKRSLIGQVRNMRRESARQAVRRMLRQNFVNDEDVKFFDQSYDARSAMVHEGHRVPELPQMVSKVQNIIATVYKRGYS